VVFVKIGGTTYRALTPPQLAKKLVQAGTPEQCWETITADGTVGMHGLSLYSLARMR